MQSCPSRVSRLDRPSLKLTLFTDETVWDFKNICIPRFLSGFDEAAVSNLEDIVKFNEEHKEQCLPPRESN